MEKENHIDRALIFLDKLEKLGAQLHKAEQQQELMLQQMLKLSQNGETESSNYKSLERNSKDLQYMINKWKPIYEQRLNMVKEAKHSIEEHQMQKG